MTGMVLIVSSVTSLAVVLGGYAVGLTRKRREEESFAAIGRNLQEEVCPMTATDKTPEADRGDILRENRPQSIDVDWDMLLARRQDAQRTPGRKSRMWALLTEIDDGNPPRLREVVGFGFWAAVVMVLAVVVARC